MKSAKKDGRQLIKDGKKSGKRADFYTFAYISIQKYTNDTDNVNVPDNANVPVNEKENENAPAPKKSI